jgi:hydroxymethylpyrimidine kinase/phosphomethylpyrimidine kinase
VSRNSSKQPVKRTLPVVCTIGTTDPTGAAGIGLDLAILPRLGVRAVFAIAAVSAQNSKRVARVDALPPAVITAQLRAIWEQVKPGAIRIGLLPKADGIAAVAKFLRGLRRRPPVIIDPVLAATSGRRFSGSAEITALKKLFKFAELVTPNASEAAMLSGMAVGSVAEAADAGRAIARAAGCAVLVKGGHLRGEICYDVLADADGVVYIGTRRSSRRMRGTGCLLAAAISAERARGASLHDAIAAARDVVASALRDATPLGSGSAQL